jgi:hypothetical protein
MTKNERNTSFIPEKAQIKERLNDARLGDLLAAIGNHEGKALLLALMSNGQAYTKPELHSLAMEAQGEQKSWKTNHTVQFDWCKYSLHPIGLVALEVIDDQANTLGYMKTEYGERIGTAFAGHLLAFSERHPETSLYKLFGSTASAKSNKSSEIDEIENTKINRSPLTSYRIFQKLLASNDPLRETDIVVSLNEKYPNEYKQIKTSVLKCHIPRLTKSGLVNFDSKNEYKPYSIYYLPSEHPQGDPQPTRKTGLKIINKIYELIKKNPDTKFTIPEFIEVFLENSPEYNKATKKTLNTEITRALNHLSKEGYLAKGKFHRKNQSEVSLSDTQRETLADLVTIIDRFSVLNEEYIQHGIRLASEITTDPERVAILMEKAKEASPNVRQSDKNETILLIKSVIKDRFYSARDIQKVLEDKYNKPLTLASIQRIMKEVPNEFGLKIEKKNNVNHYFIESEKQEETVIFDRNSL